MRAALGVAVVLAALAAVALLGAGRVLVVADPLPPRARLILRRALGAGIARAMRPSRYDAFAPARWWHVRRDAKLTLSEYEKLANYWLAESWRIAPCGGLRRSGD